MDVGFVGDVEYRIEEVLTELISALSFRLLTDYSHLVVAIQEGFQLPLHLLFHRLKHFVFPPVSGLIVQFPSLFVPGLSKFPIIRNDILALFGPPLLILQLFFLLRLFLHPLYYQ